MSAAIHLAHEDDVESLLPLVAAYHEFEQISRSDKQRETAVLPLLQGSPLGAIWLIGPRRAPVGYIVITFGWSIEMGGMDGFVDEFYIRQSVRGRGMGTEVLHALMRQLAENGLMALHLEVDRENPRAQKMYQRSGFRIREKYQLMTWLAQTAGSA